MNKDLEIYWQERFSRAAIHFETDDAMGLWSEQGFQQNFVTFFTFFKNDYSAKKKLKILDIGCGSGSYDRTLESMNNEVIGIDFSKHVIQKAVRKSKKEKINYMISALPYLPFKEGSFDTVICIGVLQYIENESTVINEIARVLKMNKGDVIFITLNSLSIRIFFKKVLNFFLHKNNSKEEKRYNPHKLKNILKNNNFSKIKIIGIYVFPKMPIYFKQLFERKILFLLNKLYPFSLFVSHAFLLKATKVVED